MKIKFENGSEWEWTYKGSRTPITAKESGLFPCPFCGQPAMLHITEAGQFYPVCTGGSGKFCLLTRTPDPQNDGFINMNDAVEVWNQRTKKGYTV